MDKRLPFFFSAFCSMMIGSSVLRTQAGVALAGVGAASAERIQLFLSHSAGAGFALPESIVTAEPVLAAAEPDPVLVAMADTVASKGFNATLEAQWLQVMGIPYAGTAPVPMKRMTVVERRDDGGERVMAIMVLTVGKRYVYYMRTAGSIGVGAVVDETAKVIGGVNLQNNAIVATVPELSESVATADRAFWKSRLLPSAVAAGK